MKGDLNLLYSKVIKHQNSSPYHFEKKPDCLTAVRAYNPICGDRFELYLHVDLERLHQVHFHGFGCAISKASTSLLVKSIEGKTIAEAGILSGKFLRFINKELPFDAVALPGELKAFEAVHDFPERYDCASLSWIAFSTFIESMTRK